MNRLAGFFLLAFLIGCSGRQFTRGAYQPPGAMGVALSASSPVVLLPVQAPLPKENQKIFAPQFSPALYMEKALETELKAAGLKPIDDAKGDKTVLKIAAVLHFLGPHKVVFDVGLNRADDTPLYWKRGYCAAFSSTRTFENVVYMALRQIIADPAFAAALAKGHK